MNIIFLECKVTPSKSSVFRKIPLQNIFNFVHKHKVMTTAATIIAITVPVMVIMVVAVLLLVVVMIFNSLVWLNMV